MAKGDESSSPPFRTQLLKWVGNKQRFAGEIVATFPVIEVGNTYFEPFLGSGAVLGTLAPQTAIASDAFQPLVGIWQCLQEDPTRLTQWYKTRWDRFNNAGEPRAVYAEIRESYNQHPNAADLLFLSRSCYGGVVRFRQRDGHMSTPCGPHKPITPESFAKRVSIWRERTEGAKFEHMDYREAIAMASAGDVIYCDPPYVDTQKILYGAQQFQLAELLQSITEAKARGAFVALSIDGTKKSGSKLCDVVIPPGLFGRELAVNVGRSMLRRFQMQGRSLEAEVVRDRLLLTD